MRKFVVLSFVVLGLGCGGSDTKVTAPTQFLPPTASADAGGGSAPSGGGTKADTSSGEKEKFVP